MRKKFKKNLDHNIEGGRSPVGMSGICSELVPLWLKLCHEKRFYFPKGD
jgi:hypothetical protein